MLLSKGNKTAQETNGFLCYKRVTCVSPNKNQIEVSILAREEDSVKTEL